MGYGAWNVRRLGQGHLTTVATKLASYNMDLKRSEVGSMDWIDLAQDRKQVAGCCECGNEPSCSITCAEFLE